MKYYYYILHVSVEDEEKFLGPFSNEKSREKALQELRVKSNENLRDPRVRARFYPANIADDVAVELGMVQEAA